MRCFLLALIALLLLAAAPASAGAAILTVIASDGQRESVPLDGMQPDVRNETYPSRKNVTGISLRAALREGSVSQVEVGEVELTGSDEGSTQLMPEQIYVATNAAVLVKKGDGVEVVTAVGTLLTVKGDLQAQVTARSTASTREGNTGNLKVTANKARPGVGEKVTFAAKNGTADARYTWQVIPKNRSGKALPGDGDTVTYQFPKPGVYNVQVFIKGEDKTDAGAVRITVGEKQAKARATPEPDERGASDGPAAGGSGRSGGGADGSGGGAGDEGAADGDPVTPGGSAPPASIPRRAPVAPEAATPAPTQESKPTPTPTPTPTRTPTPTGERVEGELLNAAVVSAPGIPADELADEVAEEPEPARNAFPVRIPSEVWLFAGLVLLAGVGWRVDDWRARPSWS